MTLIVLTGSALSIDTVFPALAREVKASGKEPSAITPRQEPLRRAPIAITDRGVGLRSDELVL
jgi:hypothetical protein